MAWDNFFTGGISASGSMQKDTAVSNALTEWGCPKTEVFDSFP